MKSLKKETLLTEVNKNPSRLSQDSWAVVCATSEAAALTTEKPGKGPVGQVSWMDAFEELADHFVGVRGGFSLAVLGVGQVSHGRG